MTYGRDAQPDMYHGDGLLRGLHRCESQVRCLARQIRFEIASIRRSEGRTLANKEWANASKEWIKSAWAARRSAQQAVISYRGLIAERDAQRALFSAAE